MKINFTKSDGNFGNRSGIRGASSRVDDEGAIHSGSQPVNMGMPEISSRLIRHREFVNHRLPFLQRTLRDMGGSIGPVCKHLLYSVPESCIHQFLIR